MKGMDLAPEPQARADQGYRALVVDDEVALADVVASYLRREQFDVTMCHNGTDALAVAREVDPDVVVLDLGLPTEDGLAIAARLRLSHPGLGIVMLTARGALTDRLDGLEGGADAYLVKPVDMLELAAVLRSLHRRLGAGRAPHPPSWELAPATLELRSPQGLAITLTVTELALLRRLADSAPQPVSRRTLAAAIGHPELDFDDRRLEVHFSRLRAKIDTAFPEQALIRAARGRGYLFAALLRVMGD